MKLGVLAFAEALLGVPKILAENSGFDPQDAIIELTVRQGSPTGGMREPCFPSPSWSIQAPAALPS